MRQDLIKKYMDLHKRLVAMEALEHRDCHMEDRLCDSMDPLWWQLTKAEQLEVDRRLKRK